MAETELNPAPTGRRPWGAVVALLAVMGVMLAVTVLLTGRITDATEQLRADTDQALLTTRTAQALLSTLDDATTAQYGYLLTMRNSYLDPYWSASSQVAEEMHVLQQQAALQEWLSPMVANLNGLVDGKMGELQRSVQLAKDQGQAAAEAEVLTDEGANMMNNIRSITGQIVARAETERERRAQLLQQAEQASALSALVLALIGVPLLGLSALGLLASRARLAETQHAAVHTPILPCFSRRACKAPSIKSPAGWRFSMPMISSCCGTAPFLPPLICRSGCTVRARPMPPLTRSCRAGIPRWGAIRCRAGWRGRWKPAPAAG